MRLSILDFSHPSGAVELAAEAASCGYTRYWLGEHHSPLQCANPLLLGAVLALANPNLRVGSGGVCLQYHSPLQVAEDARLVESMIPGRFDLGVTQGLTPSRPLAEALLDGRPLPTRERFLEKLSQLQEFLKCHLPEAHPRFGHNFTAPVPPMWLLGLSEESARWAATQGVGFCFSLHHAAGKIKIYPAIREYLQNFRPSREFPEPAAIMVVSGICAPTFKELLDWEKKTNAMDALGNTHRTIRGTPPDFVEMLEKIAQDSGVDEVMILDLLNVGSSERLEMYHLIADAYGLGTQAKSKYRTLQEER